MNWTRWLLIPVIVLVAVPATHAGWFSKKPKANPAERVPELLSQLQSSQDEAVRTAAAEELRDYDPKSFPALVPALIDALGRDASHAVRLEAATSLGKLRPISQQAGYALEQAQANDSSMRVRFAARQSLWQYHLVGYRSGKTPDLASAPPVTEKGQTPAIPTAQSKTPNQPPRNQSVSRYPNLMRETAEPPLADATANPATSVAPASPTPAEKPTAMPVNRSKNSPPSTQLIPSATSRLNPFARPANNPVSNPAPAKPDDGPALPPPS